MPLFSTSINTFTQVARTCGTSTRDLLISVDGQVRKGYLGRWSCTQARKMENVVTMDAFRGALEGRYGTFGRQAFTESLDTRFLNAQSLRAKDVHATLKLAEEHFVRALDNELLRQAQTHPDVCAGQDDAEAILRDVRAAILADEDNLPPTPTALAERIGRMITARARENGEVGQGIRLPEGENGQDAFKADNSKNAVGLSRLQDGVVMSGDETSVEDRLKNKNLAPGLRLNADKNSPMLLQSLKTNGVEPGFLYKNDWAASDTKNLMANTDDPALHNHLLALAQSAPQGSTPHTLASNYDGSRQSLCTLALQLGSGHKGVLAFAVEYLLNIARNPNIPLTPEKNPALLHLRETLVAHPLEGNPDVSYKVENFPALRDAILEGPPEGDPMADAPAFRHFTDKHIAKLDYNEGDRTKFSNVAHRASEGKFRLPERVAGKQGVLYRQVRLTTATEASVGAVAEAFANDLTRIAGVPAQELAIVKGQYSDGVLKLMLEAKFAKGYRDFDGYCLEEGRLKPTADGMKPESLGKYKAFFLLLADRDAIGSHGQNKGLIDGKFFAIDPGHSLEGDGKYLDIQDNFSFTDTKVSANKKRFSNYSVFDDATRFEKLQGLVDLRALQSSGKIDTLFLNYRAAFDPDKASSPKELELFTQIQTRLSAMKRELDVQMTKLLEIFDPQLKLYDHLTPPSLAADLANPAAEAAARTRANAIELTELLEKATSPTTDRSTPAEKGKQGTVKLNHLEVIAKTRLPWKPSILGNGDLAYTSAKPLTPSALKALDILLTKGNLKTFLSTVDGIATLTVPKDAIDRFAEALSEVNIKENVKDVTP